MRATRQSTDVGGAPRATTRVGVRADACAHQAFGYAILANRRIAGLPIAAAGDRPVIDVCLQDVPHAIRMLAARQSGPSYTSVFRSPDGTAALHAWTHPADEFLQLRYWDGTVCVLDRSGDRLWLTWPDTVRDPEEFLLGAALGLGLRLHGELCLHATAVVIERRAVLLAGSSASGKSTIAAVLGADGHPVATDDMAVVRKSSSGFSVEPGARRIRLRRDAVAVVRQAVGRELSGRVSPGADFVDLWLDEIGVQQPSAATNLGAIYFLEPDESAAGATRADDMPGADALVALAADSWATRLLDEPMRRREFESVADLVRAVPLRRLTFRPGDTSARSICDAIVGDVLRGEDAS